MFGIPTELLVSYGLFVLCLWSIGAKVVEIQKEDYLRYAHPLLSIMFSIYRIVGWIFGVGFVVHWAFAISWAQAGLMFGFGIALRLLVVFHKNFFDKVLVHFLESSFALLSLLLLPICGAFMVFSVP